MTLRDTWTPWLGPAADTITEEQLEQLAAASATIDTRWPMPDDADDRELALSAAAQVILGDDTLEGIAAQWQAARRAERQRMSSLTGALIASSGSERALMERAGVARDTVRKALGK